jgi:hypothetical protein
MSPLLVYGLGLIALTTTTAGAVEIVTRRRRADRDQRARDRERLLRPGGFRRWVAATAERARIDVSRFVGQRDRASAFAKKASTWNASISEALQKGRVKSRAWITAGALAFTALWGLAVKTEVGVDARAFHGLGYGNQMALSLAILTTLVFCVLGIALSDLVGLTHLLPAIGTTTATARVALIGVVTLAFVICVLQLPRLAEYRSQPIAAQVVDAENAVQALNLLPPSQRPPVVVSQANRALAAAKSRLATARYVDTRLAVGAATLEAATSWAAAWTILLIAQLLLGATVAAGTWRAGAAQAAITDVNQRFYARVADMAVDLEIDRPELEAALREAQPPPLPAEQIGGQPPVSAPADSSASVPTTDSPTPPEADVSTPTMPSAAATTGDIPAPASEEDPSTRGWNAF